VIRSNTKSSREETDPIFIVIAQTTEQIDILVLLSPLSTIHRDFTVTKRQIKNS
jgi:hypothetical protein